MNRMLKACLVPGGYLLAFAAAWVGVGIRQANTQGPDAQASAGMPQ